MRVNSTFRLFLALGAALTTPAFAQVPVGTGFVYQGRLDLAGSPANGDFDLQFALFDAANAGAQVGATVCADNVSITDGLFTVNLDFGAQFNGDARWLQIGVRSDSTAGNCGTGAYSTLAPRQTVGAAPYAMRVPGIDGHSLDASDGSPANALVVDTEGRVGIGTAAPQTKLDVEVGTYGANFRVFEDSGGTVAITAVGGPFPGALRLRGSVEIRPYGGSLTNANLELWNEANTGTNSVLSASGVSYLRGGPLAIGTSNPGAFLFAVNGSAAKVGGGSWSVFCDSRLKHDIAPMSGTLDRLLALRGYTFEYLPEAVENRFAMPGRQIGLLAEEVERVFPDWVEKDSDGYKYVTERATTALMVEALRELRAENERRLAERDTQISRVREVNAELQARLDRLEALLAERSN